MRSSCTCKLEKDRREHWLVGLHSSDFYSNKCFVLFFHLFSQLNATKIVISLKILRLVCHIRLHLLEYFFKLMWISCNFGGDLILLGLCLFVNQIINSNSTTFINLFFVWNNATFSKFIFLSKWMWLYSPATFSVSKNTRKMM